MHHAKEEAILFKYLEVPGVLTHCNPLPQMLHEHQQARTLVNGMQHALAAENADLLAQQANQYITLLREHIYKEDHILYPMAERGMTEAMQQALLKACESANTELASTAIWEKYMECYQALHIAGSTKEFSS